MKSGGQKTATNKPARKTAGDGAAGDRVLGARNAVRDKNLPRQQGKSSFQSALLKCDALTDEDRKAIVAGILQPTTLADLRALFLTQATLLNRFLVDGTLAAKDVIVGMGKLGTQVSAAIQLTATVADANPNAIIITWKDGHRPQVPVQVGRPVRVRDTVAGDLVDCD